MTGVPRRHAVTLRLLPPMWLERLWWRRLGVPAPMLCVRHPLPVLLARLAPLRWRAFHRWFAGRNGFYWLPCPLCTQGMGGHQDAGSVPDPARPPQSAHGPFLHLSICPACTRHRAQRLNPAVR